MIEVDEADWLRHLAQAYARPWEVADRWRAAGGRVVGLFGRYAPAELVRASGALPIRLDPARLARGAAPGEHPADVPEGLEGELSQGPLAIVANLLAGELDWIDGLLIGRDSEAHTKLFYVIREMSGDPEFCPRIPRFAFCDMLRLPVRTSAVYNRLRLRELRDELAGWWGCTATEDSLRDAISTEAEMRGLLRELDRLRADRRFGSRELLLAAGAAQVLPSADAASALQAAVAGGGRQQQAAGGPRVIVTGSAPTPEIYELIEACGLAIVGDDHCCPAGDEVDHEARDPIDVLADAYQFSSIGSARSGLDRAAQVASLARQAAADAVIQIVLSGDEASEWERAELESLLRPMPVTSVVLDPGEVYEPLRDASAALLSRLGGNPPPTHVTSGAVND